MNTLSKIIYNISTVIPLLCTFALTWYIRKADYTIPLATLFASIFIMVLLIIVFIYGKKHIAPITIRVSDISPNDGWVIGYIISYILPFANVVLEDFNLIICTTIAIIMLLILPFLNSNPPNPLLFFVGYHFYQLSAENGVSGYVLLSKRKLRKRQDVKLVGRIFEFLLLDMEE